MQLAKCGLEHAVYEGGPRLCLTPFHWTYRDPQARIPIASTNCPQLDINNAIIFLVEILVGFPLNPLTCGLPVSVFGGNGSAMRCSAGLEALPDTENITVLAGLFDF